MPQAQPQLRLSPATLAAICAIAIAGFVLPCDVRSAPSPPSQEGAELRVGFWNLRNAEYSRRTRDDIRLMARALHSIDCVALGEVRDDRLLSQLVNELMILGGRWNKARSPKKIGLTHATSERFGFVYRADKLVVHSQPRALPRKWVPVSQVPAPHPVEYPPFACTFATLDGRLDFTLVAVQITPGRDVPGAQTKFAPPASAYQDAEIRALIESFHETRREQPGDSDILLAGRFRRSPGDPALAELLDGANLLDTAAPSRPTALDSTATWDHILVPKLYCAEFTGASGVVMFDQDLFQADRRRARAACSDARPIWILLRVPDRDDD